jgi:hypothetical protein
MLPPNWFTPWVPGALYAGVYIGLCRALALPWLQPWGLAPAARAAAAPHPRKPASLAAASEAVAAPALPRPPASGASIIPFEHARARRAARK